MTTIEKVYNNSIQNDDESGNKREIRTQFFEKISREERESIIKKTFSPGRATNDQPVRHSMVEFQALPPTKMESKMLSPYLSNRIEGYEMVMGLAHKDK